MKHQGPKTQKAYVTAKIAELNTFRTVWSLFCLVVSGFSTIAIIFVNISDKYLLLHVSQIP